ncbi:MAG TPA: PH domain-containing protein [Candidatus Bipolaricaulota bacterium]|nr:PH domain-containing protein [Candidatus Bipolaricaulota bacterium]
MTKFQLPYKLEEDEDYILKVRHHFLVFLPHLLISFAIIVIDFFLLFFLFKNGAIGGIIFLAVLAISVFYVLKVVFFWHKNAFIITSKRIIDFDQQGLFTKKVSSYPFEQIREIACATKGLWQTMFKYGNLEILFFGNEHPIELYNLKDVEDLQKLLLTLIEKSTEKKSAVEPKEADEAESPDEETEDILSRIERLPETERKKIYSRLKKEPAAEEKNEDKSKNKGKNRDQFLEDYWKEESI